MINRLNEILKLINEYSVIRCIASVTGVIPLVKERVYDAPIPL